MGVSTPPTCTSRERPKSTWNLETRTPSQECNYLSTRHTRTHVHVHTRVHTPTPTHHAEADGGHDDFGPSLHPVALHLVPYFGPEPGVIRCGTKGAESSHDLFNKPTYTQFVSLYLARPWRQIRCAAQHGNETLVLLDCMLSRPP